MGYKLFTFFRSSASYRVRIALNLKGIEYRSIPMQLRHQDQRTPEFLGINPQGLVPVLADGSRTLIQSLAIIEYLDETVPYPPLLPDDPHDRAAARAIAQMIACDIHPLCNLRVLEYLRESVGVDEAGVTGWYRHWVELGLEALEAFVAKYAAKGPYCLGADISIADICLVPQLYNARRFGCAAERFHRLVTIDRALASHPEFAAALPERQPDASE